MITFADYQSGNFSQAQEEAGAAIADALEDLRLAFDIEDDDFSYNAADVLDEYTKSYLQDKEKTRS